MEVGVLFSSDGILALNKPPGMCSQGPKTSDIPELWELLRTHHPGGHVAHRIDQYTSGINLAGASKRQISYLMRNWHQITRKNYLSVSSTTRRGARRLWTRPSRVSPQSLRSRCLSVLDRWR